MKQFGVMVGLDKKAAFEGWFCKVYDSVNDFMFSVIWGYTTHEKTKHAFIQFQDSIKHETKYIRYTIEELCFKEEPFIIQIGKNTLSERFMRLDFEIDGIIIQGDFKFGDFSGIKESFLKPNIMGWLTYFPNECNHSIISMRHNVSGNLRIGNESWQIYDATGYIEKDWGTSFPKEYIWLQANDWENSSVVFSYAAVPVLGRNAKGFFLVLHNEDKEYRFTSIEGSKIKNFKVFKDSFEVTIKKGKYQLNLKAKQLNPVDLASPSNGEMKEYIKESLDGIIKLTLYIKGEEKLVLSSERASIDVHF